MDTKPFKLARMKKYKQLALKDKKHGGHKRNIEGRSFLKHFFEILFIKIMHAQ